MENNIDSIKGDIRVMQKSKLAHPVRKAFGFVLNYSSTVVLSNCYGFI